MNTDATNTATHTQTADAPGDLIDPRGTPAGAAVRPAPRPAALDGKRVLLVDNGKLAATIGPYAVLADALRTGLPEARWAQATVNLLRLDDTEVDTIADTLIATPRPEACVLALADAGVTAHTALLTVALERRSIPTVMLATPLGAGLGRAVLGARAPGLDVVVLDTVRTDSQEQVRALVAAALPHIRARLTQNVTPSATGQKSLFPPEDIQRWAGAAPEMASFQDWAEQAGIGDGLPLIPPTQAAVAAHLAAVDANADALVYGAGADLGADAAGARCGRQRRHGRLPAAQLPGRAGRAARHGQAGLPPVAGRDHHAPLRQRGHSFRCRSGALRPVGRPRLPRAGPSRQRLRRPRGVAQRAAPVRRPPGRGRPDHLRLAGGVHLLHGRNAHRHARGPRWRPSWATAARASSS